MAHRLTVQAFYCALVVASFGCSLVLEFDGYGVKQDAGPDTGAEIPLGPSVASFDSYHFERGRRAFSVPSGQGLLANDGVDSRLGANTRPTRAGGSVRIAADGSFEYAPPGATATFWGDDYFDYELLAEPSSSARVRLTVQPPALALAELVASAGAGFGVAGARIQDFVGRDPNSFAPAGDVNGDGLEDFVIGVRGPVVADSQGAGRGAYVLFGKADASNVSLADDSAARAPGFSILGDGDEQRPTNFGQTVAGAGDVNGDGFGDLIVGSYLVVTGSTAAAYGAAYVVFGKADASPVSSREILAGNGGGFAIASAEKSSASAGSPPPPGYRLVGIDVDGAGDVNGDALDDVIVGVPYFDVANGDSAGGAFVIFGKVGTERVNVDAIASGGSDEGFAIVGNTPGELLGVLVAGVGDVNGDGLSDVAASSDGSADGVSVGRNFVVLGKRDTSSVRAADIEAGGGEGFLIAGADAEDGAARIAAGGDVNGDGIDDIVIGAPNASVGPPLTPPAPAPSPADAGDASTPVDSGTAPSEPEPERPRQGIVYVAFGSREPHSFNLRELESGGGAGFSIGASEVGQFLGYTISSGDIDGDGLSDIVAGMFTQSNDARAFVIFGKRDTEPVVVPPDAAGSSSVLTIICPPAEIACISFASGSDANGDGLDDLLLGSRLYPDAPQAAGGAYLAFGWDIHRALESRDAALLGKAADDVFDLPATPIVIARGGRGTDTLRPGSALSLIDLTYLMLPGRYESIEVIDVRGNGPQRVLLDDAALRRLPQNHTGFAFGMARKLTVLGDADDTLVFDFDGFSVRGPNGGRVVYGRDGAYYGLEISQTLQP